MPLTPAGEASLGLQDHRDLHWLHGLLAGLLAGLIAMLIYDALTWGQVLPLTYQFAAIAKLVG